MALFVGMWSAPVAIRLALGVIAVAELRWDEAVDLLEQAVRFLQEKGLVVELAHARIGLSDAYKGRASAGSAQVSREDRQRAASLAHQAQANYPPSDHAPLRPGCSGPP